MGGGAAVGGPAVVPGSLFTQVLPMVYEAQERVLPDAGACVSEQDLVVQVWWWCRCGGGVGGRE